ncbi:MAG: hypothetical protein K2J99_17710, partial [Lachnospiraceae bacterium]|nr:hypothetical protein [Lachnospiraceae bacterium]
MKQKVMSMILAVTMVAGILVGCGGQTAEAPAGSTPAVESDDTNEAAEETETAGGDTKTIGAIYWSLNNNFMVFLKNNIEARAAEFGYETVAMDSGSNTETELNNVEDLI